MRQAVERFATFAQQLRIRKVGLGQAIAIVAVYPIIQSGEQRVVDHDRRIHRSSLVLSQHHPKTQAGRAAAVGHALAQVVNLKLINRVIALHQPVQITPDARMLLRFQRQNQPHSALAFAQQLAVEQIGRHRLFYRYLTRRHHKRRKTSNPLRQLLQELGHDPQPEEIAEEMNMPVERVREILKIAQEPVSLETPIGEEEDSHLGDFIPDDDALEPAEAASFTLLKEQLVEVLKTLTPREEKVLRLRFGIEDGRTRTLEEVGKEFNVTRERIRQIEAKALRKLRHPSRSKKLKDFLN